jgi:chromosome segregation ATPase
MDIEKVVHEWKQLYNRKREIQSELEQAARDIREAMREYEDVDKGVSTGDKFTPDLKAADAKIKSLKTKRNGISDRLKAAGEEFNTFNEKHRDQVRSEILKRFENVIAAQQNLADVAGELRTAAKAVDSKHGLGCEWVATRSPVAAGHNLLLDERDYTYINSLRGG